MPLLFVEVFLHLVQTPLIHRSQGHHIFNFLVKLKFLIRFLFENVLCVGLI
ncbi:hypothetical protein M2137_000353 [Parabacteroides sp. PFB2-10]|nr:hypothetical protein [Parabacteroides sp. PFB2-10]